MLKVLILITEVNDCWLLKKFGRTDVLTSIVSAPSCLLVLLEMLYEKCSKILRIGYLLNNFSLPYSFKNHFLQLTGRWFIGVNL